MEASQTRKGTELERQRQPGMEAIAPTPELYAQYASAVIDGTLPPEVGDPDIRRRAILARTFEGTLDETLDPLAKLESLSAWEGEEIIVRGFHVNPSTIAAAPGTTTPGLYAVIDFVDENGEAQIAQFGGGNVLAQLGLAWKEGAFPWGPVVMTPSKTGQGYTTWWLRRPGEAVPADNDAG